MEMEKVYGLLDDLETQVNEGKKVPLTNQYVINREAMIAAIQSVRDNLPTEMQEARRILEQGSQRLEEANNRYHNKIAEGESKSRAMLLESKQRAEKEINDAQAQAESILADAQRRANDIKVNAEREAAERVSNTTIMVEADREATRIRTEARAEAQRDRMAALDLCDELLRRAEDAAINAANELRDARLSFDRDR